MFNKGKATLFAVLWSILILTITIVIENSFPFEKVFNVSLPDELKRIIGWKLIWLIPFCFLFCKNRLDNGDKKITKTLYTDIGMFLVVTEVGILKFIYDIQKLKTKKKEIENEEKGSVLYYILSFLLYFVFIGFVVFSAIFQKSNWEKLDRFIIETLSHAKDQNTCALEYQPEFISSCSVNFEEREMILHFNSYPYWLYGIEWAKEFDVKIDGNTLYFSYISSAEKLILERLEARKEQDFSKCLNPPDEDNTEEEQIELCQCVLNVRKNSAIQYIRQFENKIARGEISENFDRNNFNKEMSESVDRDMKEKCAHLIHKRHGK